MSGAGPGSPCGGGLVLWLRDLVAGAGWGVVDHRGVPKVAYHHLRRALQPVGGLDDRRGTRWRGRPRRQRRTGSARRPAARRALSRPRAARRRRRGAPPGCDPHGSHERGVEELIGHFADVSWAYRFGRPPRTSSWPRWRADAGRRRRSSPRRSGSRPGDRPRIEPADRLGLSADARPCGDGVVRLTVRSRRLRLRRADPCRRIRPGTTPSRSSPEAPARSTFARCSRTPASAARQRAQPGRPRAAPGGGRLVTRRPPARPLYLDLASGPVFAVYHAPSADAPPSAAVLICPPWGWNDVTSYRARRAWPNTSPTPAIRPCASISRAPATAAACRPTPAVSPPGAPPPPAAAAWLSRCHRWTADRGHRPWASAASSRSRRSARAPASTSSSPGRHPAPAARSSGPNGPSPRSRPRATASVASPCPR